MLLLWEKYPMSSYNNCDMFYSCANIKSNNESWNPSTQNINQTKYVGDFKI